MLAGKHSRMLPVAEEFLISATPELQKARAEWLSALSRERRLARVTVEAYERDTRQILQFLNCHCGGAPSIGDIAELRPAKLRAFLAARRAKGVGQRTLGRGRSATEPGQVECGDPVHPALAGAARPRERLGRRRAACAARAESAAEGFFETRRPPRWLRRRAAWRVTVYRCPQ